MTHARVKPQSEILWRTTIGSHMWGMNHAGSDHDIFEVYQCDSRELLKGTAKQESYQREKDTSPKTDIAGHEIGKVVRYILDGNINFLWGVFSPIVIEGLDTLRSFRDAARRNLSSRCYNSIHGLAMHNWKKYIETEKDVTPKRLNIIGRTLLMGINLLERGEIEFQKTTLQNEVELKRLIDALDVALKNTILPAEAAHPEVLYDWLLKRRMRQLVGAPAAAGKISDSEISES